MEHTKVIDEYEDAYNKTLQAYNIQAVDQLMEKFYNEVSQLRQGDILENDRIRAYMGNLSYHMYRLRTIKARENLKATLTKHLYESTHNKTLLNLNVPDGVRYIKEEKMALAAIETETEERVAILHRAISNAIDERIQGLDKVLYNLSTAANLNMSEARLVNKGGNVA